MTPIEALIHRKISVDGPMRFDAFMQACLSLPDDGYYQHQQAIGNKGDFVTAPEISQIFGEMIGVWLLDRWIALGKPARFTVLELGPGRGTLMADALRIVGKIEPAFLSSMKLALYEQNQVLRAQQLAKLSVYSPTWLEDLGESEHVSRETPLLVVSNEFFDALPVRLFKREDQTWAEISVGAKDEKFEFAAEVLDAQMLSLMPKLENETTEVLWFEFSPSAKQISSDLANHIKASRGAMLTIDYGYAQRNFSQLSLQAVKDHEMVEVFQSPGQTDLSAHVDFGLLAQTAASAGLKTWPLMTQAEMLASLGGKQRFEQLLTIANPEQAEDLKSGYKRLTDSDAMGELFKVLCVSDENLTSWAGINE